MKNNSSNSSGIGFFGLLAIVFITLKLLGYIDWSWWYVTLPVWGGLGILLVIGIIWLGGLIIYKLIEKVVLLGKRNKK